MTSKHYAIGLARAFGGAIIFGLPLLMTMEMWSLGFSMSRGRLLLLMGFTLACWLASPTSPALRRPSA